MAIHQSGKKIARSSEFPSKSNSIATTKPPAKVGSEAGIKRAGSNVSLADSLLATPNPAILESQQRGAVEAAPRMSTSLESQGPSVQVSAVEGQGSQSRLLSLLRHGSFATTPDNQLQLALQQSSGLLPAQAIQETPNMGVQSSIPTTSDGTGGDDPRAFLYPLLPQQELFDAQSHQLEQRNQLQNHPLQIQSQHYQEQLPFNLSQQQQQQQASFPTSNTMDQSFVQQQNALLLQLEIEQKQLQSQQRQMQNALQQTGLGHPGQHISIHQNMIQQQELLLREIENDCDRQEWQLRNQQQGGANHPTVQDQAELKQQSPQQPHLHPSELQPNEFLGIPTLASLTSIPGMLGGAGGSNLSGNYWNPQSSTDEQTILQQIYTRQQQQNDRNQVQEGKREGNANGNGG